MTFPPIPQFPDDDPIRSLRMLRTYVRDVAHYVRPYQLLAMSVTVPVIGFVIASLLLGFEAALSWAADLVPLTFAVISVMVSVKKLRDEHQTVVIAFVLVLGFLGTVVMHLSRVRIENQHHSEMAGLGLKVETVGTQNFQLLSAFIAKPALSSQEAEMERRQNIEKALRSEYILSHDNISAGLLAGTELPPSGWMNRRLRELGEKWSVIPAAQVQPAPDAPQEGKVFVNLVFGDDNASGTRSYTSDDPHMRCGPEFICYPEDKVIPVPIMLDFTGKKQKRVFFAVANISEITIQRYLVTIILTNLSQGTPKGISIYKTDEAHGNGAQSGLEWKQNGVQDLIPISKSRGFSDFGIDIVASDDADLDFVIGFRIFGPNLAAHNISATFHIIRTG